MTTIQQVRVEAKRQGVTVYYDHDEGTLDAWSPRGRVFAATGCHCVAHHFERGPWAPLELRDMLEDLQLGMEPCTNPDCDTCNETADL